MKKIILSILLGMGMCLSAQAATIKDWTNTAAVVQWATAANWVGGIAPVNNLTTDIARFNQTSYTVQPTATANGNINGIIIGDGTRATATLTLTTGVTGNKLNIGAGGIVMNANSGAATIGAGTTQGLDLGADQSWANNSSSLLTVRTISNGGNVTPYTLTLAGSGSGGITIGTGNITDGGAIGTVAIVNDYSGGVTTLNGANTYTGGTTLKAGTLSLGNNAALGTGALTINGGSLNVTAARSNLNNNVQNWNGDFNFIGANTLDIGTGAVTLGGNRQVTVDASTMTVGGIIGDGGNAYSLTKAGAGTLTLSGANTYGGNTTINAGTLQASKAAALSGYGTASRLSVASGGTLALNYGGASDWTSTEVGTLLSSNGSGFSSGSSLAFDTSNGDGTYASDITTANLGLKKQGANTLTLSGANSYGGVTIVTSGALNVQNATGLGTANNTANLGTIVYSGAALQLQGGIAIGTEALTLKGTATDGALRNISGDNSYGGQLRIETTRIQSDSGTLTLGGSIIRDAVGNKTLTFGGAGNIVANGVIGQIGTGSVIKNDEGSLTLAGANTYAGTTTLNGGTLNINNAAALGSTTFKINSGTIDNSTAAAISNANNNVMTWGGDFAFTGTKDLNLGAGSVDLGTGVRTVTANAGTLTVGGAITNTGSLVKAGAGTLTLSGVNTYGGGTVLNDGTLAANNNSALGTGLLTMGGGLLANSSAVSLTNDISMSSSGIFYNTATMGLSGVISGSGALTKMGSSTLTLSGANTYDGNTTINEGTLQASKASALSGYGTASRLSVASGGTLALNYGGASDWASTEVETLLSNNGGGFSSGSFLAFDTSNGDGTYGSNITTANLGLNKKGANTLMLSGENTYSGATTISAGALRVSNAFGLGATNAGTTVASGAALELSGDIAIGSESITISGTGISSGGAIRNISGNNSIAGNITNAATITSIQSEADTLILNAINKSSAVSANTLTLGGAGDIVVNGAIGNIGVANLTKDGTGTLSLNGVNDFRRLLNLNEGTVKLGNSKALGSVGAANVATIIANGATLDLNGQAIGAEYLTMQGTGVGGNGVLVNNSATAASLSGAISNTANVTFGGSGDMTLSGVITDGGSGLITKTGAGALTLSGTNTYGGGTVLNTGTLNINSTNALGTGSFTINGGAIDNTSAATISMTNNNALTINNNFAYTGSAANKDLHLGAGATTLGTAAGTSRAITVTAQSLFLEGNIANGTTANQLVKDGAGTLDLQGTNTFTGGLVVKKGTVNLGVYGDTAGGITKAAGTGTITLGDAAGGSAYLSTGSFTVTNDINLASGAAGSLTIGSTGATRLPVYTGAIALNGNTLNFDVNGTTSKLKNYGAITGTGNLVLSNRTTTSGYIELASNTVNNAGTITSFSTNGVANVISANIGANVTDVTVTKGELTLSGTNSYTGNTTVLGGAGNGIIVGKDENLGGGTQITLNQNSSLKTTGSFATSKKIIFTAAASRLVPSAGTTLTLNGVLDTTASTDGGLFDGGGTVVLNNANNTFVANKYLLISAGNLSLGNSNALNGAVLKFNGGKILDNTSGAAMQVNGLTGFTTVGGLTFAGTDSLDLSAVDTSYTMTVGNTPAITVSSNKLTIGGIKSTGTDGAGAARVNKGLTKAGAGTLEIKGDSDYTMNTFVSNGTLIVNGSLLSSNVAVSAGATLGGIGSFQNVTLDAGAFLLPGNSPGTMTFDGALLLSSGSTTIIEIASDILYDVLKGNNANTLTAEAGSTFIFNFGEFGNTVTNGTTFVVLQNWSSLNGIGVSCVTTNLGGGRTLDTSALFIDGSVKVVPEPATIGLLGIGALFALVVTRLRRKRI